MGLSRDEFLGQREVRYMDVPIGDNGQTVRIKSLTELERSSFEVTCGAGTNKKRSLRDSRALLLCRCIVDEDGNLMMGDDDVERLHEMDARITGRVFDAAVKHIGISNEDVESLAKN